VSIGVCPDLGLNEVKGGGGGKSIPAVEVARGFNRELWCVKSITRPAESRI